MSGKAAGRVDRGVFVADMRACELTEWMNGTYNLEDADADVRPQTPHSAQ